MKQRWWFRPIIVISLAALFALLESTGQWLDRRLEGDRIPWTSAARTVLPVWFSFAIIVPFPAWMARRFPIDSQTWLLRVPIHLTAALVFCVLHLTLNLVAQQLVNGPSPKSHAFMLAWRFGRHVAVETAIYWGIAGSFMLIQRQRELRSRELTEARLTSSLRQAKLDALRAQLQPHFLYNSLNAISVLAMKSNAEPVSRAIGHLAGLLRSRLDEELPQQVQLAREMELLDRYLEIQYLRFPDRLRVERQIDPEVPEALVPCFVLQLLVENAIQHGLAQTDGGIVRIVASRVGERLEIEVTDSGPGIVSTARAGGIGLANTGARLDHIYQGEAELECTTAPGGGGRVRLRIPFQRSQASSEQERA